MPPFQLAHTPPASPVRRCYQPRTSRSTRLGIPCKNMFGSGRPRLQLHRDPLETRTM